MTPAATCRIQRECCRKAGKAVTITWELEGTDSCGVLTRWWIPSEAAQVLPFKKPSVLLSLCADASPCQISVAFSSLPSLYQPQGCWTRSPVPWLVQADHSENHGMTAPWALKSFQLTDDLCQELRRVHFVT